jgi:hypothetical protein
MLSYNNVTNAGGAGWTTTASVHGGLGLSMVHASNAVQRTRVPALAQLWWSHGNQRVAQGALTLAFPGLLGGMPNAGNASRRFLPGAASMWLSSSKLDSTSIPLLDLRMGTTPRRSIRNQGRCRWSVAMGKEVVANRQRAQQCTRIASLVRSCDS